MDNVKDPPPSYQQIFEITEKFYLRAFNDPIIGHFFFNHDHARLSSLQADFTANMLGLETATYRGRSLRAAHAGRRLSEVHFNRRKVLLSEELEKSEISASWQKRWLKMEEKLRPLIVNARSDCRE